MPIYEYKCKECGQKIELLVLNKQDEISKCPKCNGEMQKIFSVFSFFFRENPFKLKE